MLRVLDLGDGVHVNAADLHLLKHLDLVGVEGPGQLRRHLRGRQTLARGVADQPSERRHVGFARVRLLGLRSTRTRSKANVWLWIFGLALGPFRLRRAAFRGLLFRCNRPGVAAKFGRVLGCVVLVPLLDRQVVLGLLQRVSPEVLGDRRHLGVGLVHIDDDLGLDHVPLEALVDGVEAVPAGDEQVAAGLVGVGTERDRVVKALHLDRLGETLGELLGERGLHRPRLRGDVDQVALSDCPIRGIRLPPASDNGTRGPRPRAQGDAASTGSSPA